MAQRDAKKAYQSRMQQQERLAIRYLKIGQSSQCPYYKGIKIIFQNYEEVLVTKNNRKFTIIRIDENKRIVIEPLKLTE